MSDKTKFSDNVNLATNALNKLLVKTVSEGGGDGARVSEVKVNVMQFGTTLLYMPVYLLLDEIIECWKMKHPDVGLVINYLNHKNDEHACKDVRQGSYWSTDNETELTLGLSELPEDHRCDPPWYFEHSFIKRLPLWGVALRNNPKINLLKRNILHPSKGGVKIGNGSDKSGQMDVSDRAMRLRYWHVFGGKLSLLSASDFVDASIRLGISTYEPGTTVYRLFNATLKEGSYVDFMSEVGFENEFDDLFAGIVDVALTVQPWKAVRKALELGYEVETVYVHQGEPSLFSSFYCRQPTRVCDKNLLQSALSAFHLGLQEKIVCLYKLTEDNLAERCLAILNEVSSKANDGSAESDQFSVDDMNCALHLISDSRIYYYNTLNITESNRISNWVNVTNKLLCYADVRDAELNRGMGADPIATVTRLVAFIYDVYTHSPTTLKAVMSNNENDKQNIIKLMAMATRHSININTKISCKTFQERWRVLKIEKVLPKLYASVSKDPEGEFGLKFVLDTLEDQWRKSDQEDYSFWFLITHLKRALHHFDDEFKNRKLCLKDCKADVLKVGDDNGFAWLWLSYTGTVHRDPFDENQLLAKRKPWHFVSDPTAKILLHGWFVSKTFMVSEHFDPWLLFNRGHPIELKKIATDEVEFNYAGSSQKIKIIGDHGLLLTFRTTRKGVVD